MNETGFYLGLLCIPAAAIYVGWFRRKITKTMQRIEKMVDDATDGAFTETVFDESQLSSLETKFAHYLSAAETSSRNVAMEKTRSKP